MSSADGPVTGGVSASQESSGARAREALEAADLFQGLQSDTLSALAAEAVELRYPVGRLLFRQGEPGNQALILASGEVEVIATSSRGSEVPLATLGPGSTVGEMAAVTGEPRSASVRARTEVVAYALAGPTLRMAIRQDATLAARVGERIEHRGIDAFLKMSSPFVRLSASAISDIAARMRRRSLAPGETLVRQGDPGDTFYLVNRGRLEVVRARDGTTAEARIAQLGPGDCVGEAAVLTDRPRNATVRALEEAEVLELSRADFEAVVQQHRSIGAFFRELFLARYHFAPRALMEAVDPAGALMPGLRPGQTRRVLALFGVGLLVLAGASAASIWTANPALSFVTLTFGALLPATAYVAFIRERALLRQVPVRTLLVTGLASAAIAIPLAVYLERLAISFNVPFPIAVALIEEPIKLVGVGWAMSRRQYRFALDGVIFGMTAAMGFGALESFAFSLNALVNPLVRCDTLDGPTCMVPTTWLRMITVLLGHGPWTAIICATVWRDWGRRGNLLTPAVGLAFAFSVTLHAIWDAYPGRAIASGFIAIIVLRRLMREGLAHQRAAVAALSLIPPGSHPEGDVEARCVRCDTRFPASAIYCVRCGLSLA